ncbi:hypothetical protein GALL_371060 [mine drainage metagenome]|jgi:predicted Fe-S protein YdhL (DUF1289 family)|uniref:Fe-S protein n=1 Tax=mine drainage metagenome TaxID=410659 RepID=A0A1J5QYZ9_9ZZZZ
MPVPSPCVQICTMDEASGLCRGCARTLAEIATWSALDDEAKREVLARVAQRRAAAPAGGARMPPPAQKTRNA